MEVLIAGAVGLKGLPMKLQVGFRQSFRGFRSKWV